MSRLSQIRLLYREMRNETPATWNMLRAYARKREELAGFRRNRELLQALFLRYCTLLQELLQLDFRASNCALVTQSSRCACI